MPKGFRCVPPNMLKAKAVNEVLEKMEQKQFVLQAPVILLSELQSNSIYISVKMRMFSTRPNRNDMVVTEAFIDEIVSNSNKYICIPLCADVNKLNNGDYKGLGHMFDKTTGKFHTQQIGSFYAFEKVRDEFGLSLIGEARISKRNEKVIEALKGMFEQEGLNFSFEILAADTFEKEGVLVIDASEHNTLVGMAVVSIPAYPESKAMALVAELDDNHSKQQAFEHTQYKLSGISLETIGVWVWTALKENVREDILYTLHVDRVCVDHVLIYSVETGKTYKMEYVIGDESLVVTDVYEVSYARKEDSFMSEIINNPSHTHSNLEHTHGLTGIEPIVEPVVVSETLVDESVIDEGPVVAPVEPVITEIAEPVEELPAEVPEIIEEPALPVIEEPVADIEALKAEVERLKAEVSQLSVYKEKNDEMLAEEATRELNAKRETIKAFAEKNGLSVEDAEVEDAIVNVNYEKIAELSMKNTKDAAKSVNPFTSEIKTISNKYTLLDAE